MARHAKLRSVHTAGRCVAVLLVLVGWAVPAWGQFNGDFAIERFRLDSENFLDFRAYQPLPDWEQDWRRARNAMTASVGSVSQERFYFFHELKLETALGRYVSFHYRQVQDAFFRPHPLYQEVELRAGSGVRLGLVGMPQSEKRFTNAGLALTVGEPTGPGYLRYTHLEQFTEYNKRSPRGVESRFSPIPKMERYEGRYVWGGRLLLEADVRVEEPTRLKQPEAPHVQTYEGQKVNATAAWLHRDVPALRLTYSGNRELRSRSDPEQGVAQEQVLTWGWLDGYVSGRPGEGHRLTAGWMGALFVNRIDATAAADRFRSRLTTEQAYGFWQHDLSSWVQMVYALQAGVVHLGEDRGDKPYAPVRDNRYELKAGVGVVLRETGRYRFFFNTTWDLDIVDQRQWDGGNVQVQLFF